MNTLYRVVLSIAVIAMFGVMVSCASESPETQKLYTDAKQMWDDLNRAFTLEKGQERIDLMNKVLSEEWDTKIIKNLEDYLKAAPKGKYATEATTLLEQAKASDRLRMLGQARPMLKMMGGQPKTVQEVDSLAKQPVPQDTTK